MKGPSRPRVSRSFKAKAGSGTVTYGYSTRRAGYPDFYRVLEKNSALFIPDQTHSANIHRPSGNRSKRAGKSRTTTLPDCDALITGQKGLTLTVRTADCLPIFIWDRSGRSAAMVHAGWKGTHQKIAAKTVARLKRLGSDPADLRIVFGPAIRSCCYEVGPEFLERFPAETFKPNRRGRHQFDLTLANRMQLEAAGVRPRQMKDLGLCTACDTKTFFSFRRDPANTGRMIHWIRLD